MKRFLVCVVLLVCLVPLAQAETIVTPPFLPQIGQQAELPWYLYDNQVYMYGFSLPGEFFQDDPAVSEAYLAQQEPDAADYLYDRQSWHSMDGRLRFEFQLKKPSYASLDEEVAKLPAYLEQLKEDLAEQEIDNVRFSHDEVVLHDLPAGTMLEVPVEFDIVSNTGHTFTVHSIYYDYYDPNNEYIFYIQGVETSYEELSGLLHSIAQTIRITPIILK